MEKPKNKKGADIIATIHALLDELEEHIVVDSSAGGHVLTKKAGLSYSGASGGIRMLIRDGYFKEMRSLPEVILRLRQEGFNYPRNTISMTLLRAVRQRILVRIYKGNGKSREKWVYVIRK